MIISSVVTAPENGTKAPVRTPAPRADAADKKSSAAAAMEASPAQLSQAVKQVNESFIAKGQNLAAYIEKDKATGLNVVKITDKVTNEVINQYPSKSIIAIAESISQSLDIKGKILHVRG